MKLLRSAPLLLLLWAGVAAAEEAPLASRFPADTFLYLEADAGALDRGIRQLDLVKLLLEPKFRGFFAPMLGRIGASGDDPLGTLYRNSQLDQWLVGRAAVGIRGATIKITGSDGAVTEMRVSPDSPLSARVVNTLAGLAMLDERGAGTRSAVVQLDMMAVIEPPPALKAMVEAMIESPPPGVALSYVEMGGRKLLRAVIGGIEQEFLTFDPSVYADLSGPVWVLATNPDMLLSPPRTGLGESPRFAKVRGRMTNGERALFGYFDVAAMAGTLRNLVAPLLVEELELSGLAGLQGLGVGISMTEGGVRESLGLVFDGQPRGFLTLLGAMSGGLQTLEAAEAGTTSYIGFKFDMQALVDRWRGAAGGFLPGTETLLEEMLQSAFSGMGIDFRGEFLPALGNEVALALGQPMGGIIPIPQWTLFLKLRDEAKFKTLLGKAVEMSGGLPVQLNPVDIGDGGDKGLQVMSGLPMLPPVLAVRNGWWLGGSDLDYLKASIAGLSAPARKSLAKESPVFAQVLRGLGGRPEEFAGLFYVDLRALAPLALSQGLMMVPTGFVDVGHLPDLNEVAAFLSGMAIAIRNSPDGLSLDMFSPVGVLPAATLLAPRSTRRRRQDAPPPAPPGIQEGKRAILGLEASSEGKGVVVDAVTPKGPCEAAGLQAGDLIVGIDDLEVKEIATLERYLAEKKPGETVSITAMRGDTMMLFGVTLGAR